MFRHPMAPRDHSKPLPFVLLCYTVFWRVVSSMKMRNSSWKLRLTLIKTVRQSSDSFLTSLSTTTPSMWNGPTSLLRKVMWTRVCCSRRCIGTVMLTSKWGKTDPRHCTGSNKHLKRNQTQSPGQDIIMKIPMGVVWEEGSTKRCSSEHWNKTSLPLSLLLSLVRVSWNHALSPSSPNTFVPRRFDLGHMKTAEHLNPSLLETPSHISQTPITPSVPMFSDISRLLLTHSVSMAVTRSFPILAQRHLILFFALIFSYNIHYTPPLLFMMSVFLDSPSLVLQKHVFRKCITWSCDVRVFATRVHCLLFLDSGSLKSLLPFSSWNLLHHVI